jgi:NADH dehydrogenase FAD-containing subunit
VAAEGGAYDLPYDYLVVALGASTNDGLIPGSSNALTFKTMADALVLRNHLMNTSKARTQPRTRRSGAGV